jgi:hypothetical protein
MTTLTFGIGLTAGGVVDLASIGVASPLVQPNPSQDLAVLGDGSRRALGGAHIVWQWGFLGDKYKQGSNNDPREALRAYCAGPSAFVYLVTPTNENDLSAGYYGLMLWPFPESRQAADAHRRLDFVLEFLYCVPAVIP